MVREGLTTMKTQFNCKKVPNINKAMAPQDTLNFVKSRLNKLSPTIVDSYQYGGRAFGMSKCKILGTPKFVKASKGFLRFAPIDSGGKGITDEMAYISGLMELVERFSCSVFLNREDNYSIYSFNESDSYTIQDYYLDSNENFDDSIKSLLSKLKLRWYTAFSLDGDEVQLPMNFIHYTQKSTNGMAAGNTIEEAIFQGTCELIERHWIGMVWKYRRPVPSIDIESVDCEIAKKIIKRITDVGYEIYLKDFSLGFELPVIAAIRVYNGDIINIAVGVSTNKKEALLRALTENYQTEGSNEYPDGKPDFLFQAKKNKLFNELFSREFDDFGDDINYLNDLLKSNGFFTYYIDTTHSILKVPSVIVHTVGAKYFRTSRTLYDGIAKECFEINNYDFLDNNIEGTNLFSSYNKAVYFANIGKYEQAIDFFKETIGNVDEVIDCLSIFGLAICSYFLGDRKNLLKNINHLKRNFLEVFHPDFYKRREHSVINISDIHFEKIREMWINSVQGSIGNLKWRNYT